jgi:hypothetical protein
MVGEREGLREREGMRERDSGGGEEYCRDGEGNVARLAIVVVLLG